ncbi:hypothetical protein [Yersinia ruckeri]|nr:hypothetical protein [Yersinia ruckeri]EKN4207834.1 hypothetical protein [Yersinia ruckeri]EKN4209843.1 hypothetical protein [Yersinia ruckeri]EKN4686623.1 hypothetical protein [Yersinia ruckeri]EKN4690005.1 hypothetical protein [Yersinia ruckeri]EKN4699292.1 hypothetical protein [Yersinia ruckeri]
MNERTGAIGSRSQIDDKVLAAMKPARSSRHREYRLVGSFRTIPGAET